MKKYVQLLKLNRKGKEMIKKNLEEYWAQTRKKWENKVVNPLGGSIEGCGFCQFIGNDSCDVCPVTKVYGHVCDEVESVGAYSSAYRVANPNVEELSRLAKAVVQELDDKKTELIAAMHRGKQCTN